MKPSSCECHLPNNYYNSNEDQNEIDNMASIKQ